MVEATFAYTPRQFGKFLAASNAKAPALCRAEDGFELVSPAEVSQIADNQTGLQAPIHSAGGCREALWARFPRHRTSSV
jgi:hypothetical protein